MTHPSDEFVSPNTPDVRRRRLLQAIGGRPARLEPGAIGGAS